MRRLVSRWRNTSYIVRGPLIGEVPAEEVAKRFLGRRYGLPRDRLYLLESTGLLARVTLIVAWVRLLRTIVRELKRVKV